MFFSINMGLLIIPAVILQYILALFCLVQLVMSGTRGKKFWLWNVFILLGVFVGVISFLICYYGFRDKFFKVNKHTEAVNNNEQCNTDKEIIKEVIEAVDTDKE